jgi:hypothetical protein
MHFEWSNGFWRWCPSPEPATNFGGNITSMVSNVLPTFILTVGGLFEITMPANTDVRIRSFVPRQAYITSEGEYNGGSFTTTTSAVVNLTTTAVPADNNVHVAGEKNIITIQDVLTGRIFRVTVWRLAGVAGNWSGWCEEIGISINPILTVTNPLVLANNQITYTAPYIRGFGKISVGDLNIAVVVPAESTLGITASMTGITGGGILTVNMPVDLVPDTAYKVFVTVTSNPAEAAASNATVVFEIAAGKTTTAFRIILREYTSAVQNCNVEFIVVR